MKNQKIDKCPFWKEDQSEAYKNSGICEHYGRYSGRCMAPHEGTPELCLNKGKNE